ncbi:MAG: DUF6390 family protein [Nocardioides sp.]
MEARGNRADPPASTTASDAALAGQWRSSRVAGDAPYPPLLRGRGPPAGPAVAELDRCRIRTGTVRSIEGEWLSVTSSVLTWDGAALHPGQPVGERVRLAVDGASLMEVPQVGDLVALHWGWVCDTLSEEQAARIDRLEAAQRAAVGR